MATELEEAMASGVLVEVRGARDESLAQAVFLDWHGRPVPCIGDTMCCDVVSLSTGRKERVRGLVRSRHFDVQTDEAGGACVWVRVVLDAVTAPTAPRAFRTPFSTN